MDERTFREELERQNRQFAAAMKQLEDLGAQGVAVPEETLRAIDEACEPRAARQVATFNYPGVRA